MHSPGSFPFSDATHSTIQQRTLLAREIIRHIATLGLLAFASIWGLLAREGLVSLNTYDGMSVQPLVWAQAVGCLVMGWTVGNKEVLEEW